MKLTTLNVQLQPGNAFIVCPAGTTGEVIVKVPLDAAPTVAVRTRKDGPLTVYEFPYISPAQALENALENVEDPDFPSIPKAKNGTKRQLRRARRKSRR